MRISRTIADSHFENFQRQNNWRWVRDSCKIGSTHWTIRHPKKINQFLGLAENSVFETTFDRKYRMEGRNYLHEGPETLFCTHFANMIHFFTPIQVKALPLRLSCLKPR
jgi:hypothetical protein